MWIRLLFPAIVAVLIAIQGCSDDEPTAKPTPPDPMEQIQEFVESQPLPKPQPVQVIVDLESDVTFFALSYGDLHEDMAGDWYDGASGVRYGQKIGWITISGQILPQPTTSTDSLVFYDPVANDVDLFSQATWDALRSAGDEEYDHWLYWSGLLPMLARDSDVPEETLLAIAEQLPNYIAPWVAWPLLRNTTVQSSREMLTVLANLPVYQGDSYLLIRQRAQELLAALPPA